MSWASAHWNNKEWLLFNKSLISPGLFGSATYTIIIYKHCSPICLFIKVCHMNSWLWFGVEYSQVAISTGYDVSWKAALTVVSVTMNTVAAFSWVKVWLCSVLLRTVELLHPLLLMFRMYWSRPPTGWSHVTKTEWLEPSLYSLGITVEGSVERKRENEEEKCPFKSNNYPDCLDQREYLCLILLVGVCVGVHTREDRDVHWFSQNAAG